MAQAKDRRLYDAVSYRKLDEVLKLINEGVNLEDTFDDDEKTPLILACNIDATDIALALIEKGANVNARDIRDTTALWYASFMENTSVTTSLIRNGADINAVDKDGNTALIQACGNRDAKIALILIENGANANIRTNENVSPLLLACRNNLTDVVVSLIHNGADVNELDEEGNTVLNLVCKYGKAELALFLIQNGANVTLRNKAGRSPLNYACQNDLSDVIVSLIHNGAEVNETYGLNNGTALHYAAAKNRSDIISMLLHKGADLNVLNKNGKTPLQLALENQSTDAFEVLRRYAERCANAKKLNRSRSSTSKKVKDAVKTNKFVEEEFEKVNNKLVQIDKTLQTILTRLEHLETKAKSNDQENIKNVLEIAGIESKENEDLDLILLRLGTILGLSLQDKANIISVHRPIKTSPATDSASAACSNVIEVKFRTFETTQNWLKAFKEKRSLGITSSALDPSLKSEKIFVNQKLTLYNKELLHRAKEFAKDKGYKFVWFEDGKIFLRKGENSRLIRVLRDADLPA